MTTLSSGNAQSAEHCAKLQAGGFEPTPDCQLQRFVGQRHHLRLHVAGLLRPEYIRTSSTPLDNTAPTRLTSLPEARDVTAPPTVMSTIVAHAHADANRGNPRSAEASDARP